MKKAILVILLLLFIPLVFAYTDYNVQIKNRISGVKHNCELGQNTCFGRFHQECQRDTSNNIMWNTIDSCGINELCDDKQGCVKNVFNTPISEKVRFTDQKPDWAECIEKESKCSDDLTKMIGCKSGKWTVRQVCSEEAICMNQFGCIKKEEVKKEVSAENYDHLIGLQTKRVDERRERLNELEEQLDDVEDEMKEAKENAKKEMDDALRIIKEHQERQAKIVNKISGQLVRTNSIEEEIPKKSETVGFIGYILSWFFRS